MQSFTEQQIVKEINQLHQINLHVCFTILFIGRNCDSAKILDILTFSDTIIFKSKKFFLKNCVSAGILNIMAFLGTMIFKCKKININF